MQEFFRRHWFLTSLATLIVAGMTLGIFGYGPSVRPFVDLVNPRVTTACVLFLMAFSLDSDHLRAAFRAPLPVVLGFAVNLGLVPLLAWGLMSWQQTADFRVGLMIAASVPCTTAAASVMTRKARGNDAVSLLVTVATNLSCFLLTPLWLQWTTAQKAELDARQLMLDLLQAVLLPTVAGQLARQPVRLHDFAARHKTAFGVAAQLLIELLVLTAALRAGTALFEIRSASENKSVGAAISAGGVLRLWVSCLAIHFAGLTAGWFAARRTGSPPRDAIAVALAGSQKTLPIGLYIATDPALFGEAFPFAMFPMLLYHTSQLFFDTWLATRIGATAPAP